MEPVWSLQRVILDEKRGRVVAVSGDAWAAPVKAVNRPAEAAVRKTTHFTRDDMLDASSNALPPLRIVGLEGRGGRGGRGVGLMRAQS